MAIGLYSSWKAYGGPGSALGYLKPPPGFLVPVLKFTGTISGLVGFGGPFLQVLGFRGLIGPMVFVFAAPTLGFQGAAAALSFLSVAAPLSFVGFMRGALSFIGAAANPVFMGVASPVLPFMSPSTGVQAAGVVKVLTFIGGFLNG